MAHYDELMKSLKAAAFDLGIPELSRRSKISDDTIRRMLSDDPPKSIKNLQRLEEVAAEPRPPAP